MLISGGGPTNNAEATVKERDIDLCLVAKAIIARCGDEIPRPQA